MAQDIRLPRQNRGQRRKVRAHLPVLLPARAVQAADRVFRFLDEATFVNAIAPNGGGTKILRSQYGLLFKVADTAKRGLVSWDDFVVFETTLKRPDADYWIAFSWFDVCVSCVSSSASAEY